MIFGGFSRLPWQQRNEILDFAGWRQRGILSRRNRGQSTTAKGSLFAERNPLDPRKSIFGFLWENLSEPSGRFATLSACDRCPPCFVLQFAVWFVLHAVLFSLDVERTKRSKGQPIIRQMALFFLYCNKTDGYANMRNDQRRNHLSLVVCSVSNLLDKWEVIGHLYDMFL